MDAHPPPPYESAAMASKALTRSELSGPRGEETHEDALSVEAVDRLVVGDAEAEVPSVHAEQVVASVDEDITPSGDASPV